MQGGQVAGGEPLCDPSSGLSAVTRRAISTELPRTVDGAPAASGGRALAAVTCLDIGRNHDDKALKRGRNNHVIAE